MSDTEITQNYSTILHLNTFWLEKKPAFPPAHGKLLFLAGWRETCFTWTKLFSLLGQHNYHLLALDLPGFGNTQLPPKKWGIAEYSNFVSEFLKLKLNYYSQNLSSRQTTNQLYIIGHSFGGRLGIYYAGHSSGSLEGLILISSPGFKSIFKQTVGFIANKLRKGLERFDSKKIIDLGRKTLDKIFDTSDYRQAGPLKEVLKNILAYDLTQEMKKINCPVLIIHGDQDQVVPLSSAKRMNDLIKNSKLEIIKTGHHFLPQERAELVYQLINNFISQISLKKKLPIKPVTKQEKL